MRIKFFLPFLAAVLAASLAILIHPGHAQTTDASWTTPIQLSSRSASSTQAELVADHYGNVHMFWGEALGDNRSIIKYSRFDGGSWSVPISVYIGPEFFTFDSIAPIIGSDGRLYLYWTEGILTKNIRVSSAPVTDTLSAEVWTPAIRIQIICKNLRVVEDSRGVHHVIFNRIDPIAKGLYYISSRDRGNTWSSPLWLDPDLPPTLTPTDLNLAVDEQDNLHIAWGYADLEQLNLDGNWIRYGRMDAATGEWTKATLDRIEEQDLEIDYKLNAAGPVLALSGREVVVIWAGGTLNYRHFRHSSDGGLTWSTPVRLFGGLNGQAGDGMAVDGVGRIHYFAQIRFPMGIYHSIWDGTRWTAPSLIYFIRHGDEETGPDIVEAHATHPTIRAGNQIVLSFTDSPGNPTRGVYAITTTLSDVAPMELSIPPTPLPTQIPFVQPTATAEPAGSLPATPTAPLETGTNTPARIPGDAEGIPSTAASPTANSALIIGMLLSTLVLGTIITIRIIARR